MSRGPARPDEIGVLSASGLQVADPTFDLDAPVLPPSAGSPRHRLIRAAERLMPAALFAALAAPAAWASTIRDVRRRRWNHSVGRLRGLSPAAGRTIGWRELLIDRFRLTAAGMVVRFPERLREPRWRRRCRIVDDHHLRAALATGRPVVLLSLHYGTLWPLHHWMRASGFATAAISLPRPVDPVRAALDAAADRAFGCAGVPRTFGVDGRGLRRALAYLTDHSGILGVVIDGGGGGAEPAEVVACGVRSKVRLGGFRIAEAANAIAIPTLMRATPRMGCEITFCPPVPDDLIADRGRHLRAAEDALGKLLPLALRAPGQFDPAHAPKAA